MRYDRPLTLTHTLCAADAHGDGEAWRASDPATAGGGAWPGAAGQPAWRQHAARKPPQRGPGLHHGPPGGRAQGHLPLWAAPFTSGQVRTRLLLCLLLDTGGLACTSAGCDHEVPEGHTQGQFPLCEMAPPHWAGHWSGEMPDILPGNMSLPVPSRLSQQLVLRKADYCSRADLLSPIVSRLQRVRLTPRWLQGDGQHARGPAPGEGAVGDHLTQGGSCTDGSGAGQVRPCNAREDG